MTQPLSPLPACCMDFDISLEHLLFPELMDANGREFIDAHGLSGVPLRMLQRGAVNMGDGKVKIKHRCAQLTDNGRCLIYATRPVICAEFDCGRRADCACHGTGNTLVQVEG